MSGRLSLQRVRLVRNGVITLALTAALVGGIRVFFETAVEAEYTGYRVFVEMDLSREPGPSKVLPTVPPAVPHEPGRSRLEEIDADSLADDAELVEYLSDTLMAVSASGGVAITISGTSTTLAGTVFMMTVEG